MVAAQASRTVTLYFSEVFVPHERVTATAPQEKYLQSDTESLRFTGILALGVAGRAISLMGDDGGELAAELGCRAHTAGGCEP